MSEGPSWTSPCRRFQDRSRTAFRRLRYPGPAQGKRLNSRRSRRFCCGRLQTLLQHCDRCMYEIGNRPRGAHEHLSGRFEGPYSEEILDCVLACLSDAEKTYWQRLRDGPGDTLHEEIVPVFLAFEVTLRRSRLEELSAARSTRSEMRERSDEKTISLRIERGPRTPLPSTRYSEVPSSGSRSRTLSRSSYRRHRRPLHQQDRGAVAMEPHPHHDTGHA